MSKPLGIEFVATGNSLGLRVTPTDKATDAVWEAVERAQESGMSVRDFLREAREAWAHGLREQQKHAMSEFDRANGYAEGSAEK